MRIPVQLFMVLALGSLATIGCHSAKQTARAEPIVPTVELSGSAGARLTGYYVSRSERHELDGILPLTIRDRGLTEVAVRKLESQDSLQLAARTSRGDIRRDAPAKRDEGLRVMLDTLSISSIPPQESLTLPEEKPIRLRPYWREATWVFDDPTRGLEQEPLLKGAAEILNRLSQDVSEAKAGFDLTLAGRKFAGFQQKLIRVRTGPEGNRYRLEGTTLEGWWGQGLFRYFPEPPKALYLKAAPGAKASIQ